VVIVFFANNFAFLGFWFSGRFSSDPHLIVGFGLQFIYYSKMVQFLNKNMPAWLIFILFLSLFFVFPNPT